MFTFQWDEEQKRLSSEILLKPLEDQLVKEDGFPPDEELEDAK